MHFKKRQQTTALSSPHLKAGASLSDLVKWPFKKNASSAESDAGKRTEPHLGKDASIKKERLRESAFITPSSADAMKSPVSPASFATDTTAVSGTSSTPAPHDEWRVPALEDILANNNTVTIADDQSVDDPIVDNPTIGKEPADTNNQNSVASTSAIESDAIQTLSLGQKAQKNPALNVLLRGRQRKQQVTATPQADDQSSSQKGKKTRDPKVPKAHKAKASKTVSRNVEAVALGVTFNNADFWLKLRPDGSGENLNISALETTSSASLTGIRFFRLANYDKGLQFSKNLRGKNLRNAMLREKEISDIPTSVLAHHIRWFTRKSQVQVAKQPVHPLGLSLWAYAKKQGWQPEKGILLYTGIPIQNSTLWIYVALGQNGMGIPQVANINAEADRPAYNMSFATGLLTSKEYATHAIAPEDLFQWLAQGRHVHYPQPGEWLGLKSQIVGKGVMILGLAACIVSGGFWWYAQGTLQAAQIRMQAIQREASMLNQRKEAFLRAHLPEIAYSFHIPLDQDLAAAIALWKPGTSVILADGLPLGVSGNNRPSPIAMPGSPMSAAHSAAEIAVTIPESKNLGSGQKNWVSPKILSSVIEQPATGGFSLQRVIQKNLGGGYVVIFTRAR